MHQLTGYTPLHAVCRRAPQNVAFVDMLVMAGAEVNTNATRRHVDGLPTAVGLQLQQTPLLDVCQSRSDACARRLIEHGADIGIQLVQQPWSLWNMYVTLVVPGWGATCGILCGTGYDRNTERIAGARLGSERTVGTPVCALHGESTLKQVECIRNLMDALHCMWPAGRVR